MSRNSVFRRNTWNTINANVSQGLIDDPKKAGSKVLSSAKNFKPSLYRTRTTVDGSEGPTLMIGVFFPESGGRLAWDVCAGLLIIYQAITVPYFLCFHMYITGFLAILEFVITFFYILDILVAFNTGYYSRGALVLNRCAIARHYIRFWFWFDLVASFPYTWITDGPLQIEEESSDSNIYKAPQLLRLIRFVRFLRCLRLLQIAKLKQILIRLEDYIASNTLASLFMFLKMLFAIFFIAHWIACLWFWIGDVEREANAVTWVTVAGATNLSNYDKYITALYWSVTTMATVGYGDIVPHTFYEKIFAMFAMIVACGVFAYTIGSIGSLVSKQNAESNLHRERLNAVNKYMKKKNLSHDLQFRVRRYLEYIWENQKQNNLEEKEILKLLSEPLRDEIYAHINGVVIRGCPIFLSFEEYFISQLTKLLEIETYAPGDIVFEEGEIGTKMFFIQNGMLSIYHKKTKSTFIQLEPGNYFGEISFFTEMLRCASASCLDFVDLLVLNKKDLSKLLEKFPDAKTKVEVLGKKGAEGDLSALEVICYACKHKGHVAPLCPKISLNYNQEETKKAWLRQRTSQTRLVNANYTGTNFNRRVPKNIMTPRYNGRYVLGKPRKTFKMFPDEPEMFHKLKRFMEHKKSRSDSSTSLSNEELKSAQQLASASKIVNPALSMIYKESEMSDEDLEEPKLVRFAQSNLSVESAKKLRKSSKVVPSDYFDHSAEAHATMTLEEEPASARLQMHNTEVDY
mmetsp:Transcript_34093/g.59463  ORF Transcript_34093/g.59463 Transcript_34093/m.59463 type:complete len:742 (-) Transcript_34093:61-2286(-)